MHLAGHSHDTEFGPADLDTYIVAAGDCVWFNNRFEDTRAGREQGLQRVAAASGGEPSYVPYPGDLDAFALD